MELSLGKINTLQLISTESTISVILENQGLGLRKDPDVRDRLCLLIQPHSLIFSSCSLEPIAQSGLLQCIPHDKPPPHQVRGRLYHLLYLETLLSRIRDFNPVGHPFKGLYLPFEAHTSSIFHRAVSSNLKH